jgi:phosphopantothenoylcysteine decarboxylase/phosphopantothenate--cysteine ligase
MLEPAHLLANLEAQFKPGKLQGVEILLTAGPTREAIDPVRYISNRSSGKMGYALARAALREGASVTLVSGPVALLPPPGAQLISVESAAEMYAAVMQEVKRSNVFIACAAVSDYRVDQQADHKIKKSTQTMTLDLVPNEDILAAVSALKKRPFCVGFAAETRDLERYALAKLERKNLDMIAANLVGDGSGGFETDINRLEVFWPEGRHSIAQASKLEVAKQLIELIGERYTGALSDSPSTA